MRRREEDSRKKTKRRRAPGRNLTIDDQRGLAAEFESDPFQVRLPGRAENAVADGGGPGESDLVNIRVHGDVLPAGRPVSCEEVDDSWWEAGFPVCHAAPGQLKCSRRQRAQGDLKFRCPNSVADATIKERWLRRRGLGMKMGTGRCPSS